MVYVKLVNMEDKPCGISHEFVFRRNLNVHFVALPIRSVETLSTSNFFCFVDNSLKVRWHTKQMFKDATERCELSRTNHAAFLMNLYSVDIWTSILSLCRAISFLLWTIPCRLGGTLWSSKCSKTLLNFVNAAAQYFCITTQSTSTVSKECFHLTPYWFF